MLRDSIMKNGIKWRHLKNGVSRLE